MDHLVARIDKGLEEVDEALGAWCSGLGESAVLMVAGEHLRRGEIHSVLIALASQAYRERNGFYIETLIEFRGKIQCTVACDLYGLAHGIYLLR
jgi:hypothetical protein